MALANYCMAYHAGRLCILESNHLGQHEDKYGVTWKNWKAN